MPLRLIIEELCQNFIAWSKVPTKSAHLIRMYYINAISIVSHHLNFIVTSGSWPSHYRKIPLITPFIVDIDKLSLIVHTKTSKGPTRQFIIAIPVNVEYVIGAVRRPGNCSSIIFILITFVLSFYNVADLWRPVLVVEEVRIRCQGKVFQLLFLYHL